MPADVNESHIRDALADDIHKGVTEAGGRCTDMGDGSPLCFEVADYLMEIGWRPPLANPDPSEPLAEVELRKNLIDALGLTDADGPINDQRLTEEIRHLVTEFEDAAAARIVLLGRLAKRYSLAARVENLRATLENIRDGRAHTHVVTAAAALAADDRAAQGGEQDAS